MPFSSCRSWACRRTSWRAAFLPAGQVQTHSPASGVSWMACESLPCSSTHLLSEASALWPAEILAGSLATGVVPACLASAIHIQSHGCQAMASQEAVHAAVSASCCTLSDSGAPPPACSVLLPGNRLSGLLPQDLPYAVYEEVGLDEYLPVTNLTSVVIPGPAPAPSLSEGQPGSAPATAPAPAPAAVPQVAPEQAPAATSLVGAGPAPSPAGILTHLCPALGACSRAATTGWGIHEALPDTCLVSSQACHRPC